MCALSTDTIAAPITAPGKAAVSVVRVSGSLVRQIITQLLPVPDAVLLAPRKLVLAEIKDLSFSDEAAVLDHALVAFFPAPHSFTGEDCVEFNLHGSPLLVSRLLENLTALGARMARAGEFTERAFLLGQIDLSQAEAVADVIAAETQAQLRLAQRQLAGRLSSAIADLGEPLRDLLAEIEAYIDFPEEGIEPLVESKWRQAIESVNTSITGYLSSYSKGRLIREGAQVVIAGVPNAGKSSLLNAISGEDRAIVTPIPGTTRDSIEMRIDLSGLAVSFWDTAGLADAEVAERELDEVELLGIARSWKHVSQADLAIVVINPGSQIEEQKALLREVQARTLSVLCVVNKTDLLDDEMVEELLQEFKPLTGRTPLFVSAMLHSNVDDLCRAVLNELVGSVNSESVLIANRRHFEALTAAQEALQSSLDGLKQSREAELVALDLRSALGALQDIVGVTHTEDILGRIFSKFCIGK